MIADVQQSDLTYMESPSGGSSPVSVAARFVEDGSQIGSLTQERPCIAKALGGRGWVRDQDQWTSTDTGRRTTDDSTLADLLIRWSGRGLTGPSIQPWHDDLISAPPSRTPEGRTASGGHAGGRPGDRAGCGGQADRSTCQRRDCLWSPGRQLGLNSAVVARSAG